MAKTVELLLTESVESLGIVGDVVKVRTGYARNYLLPRDMATTPSDEKIKALAVKRADAEKQVAEQRKFREEMVSKLEGVEVTLERSCNDQGLLYGSITQQDIATALNALGFGVRPRDIRINETIKRIDSYDIPVRPESDLEATVKLWVVADRELNLERDRDEREFDDEGNVIEGKKGKKQHDAEPKADGGEKAEKKPKAEKHEKAEKKAAAHDADEKPAKKPAKKAKAEA